MEASQASRERRRWAFPAVVAGCVCAASFLAVFESSGTARGETTSLSTVKWTPSVEAESSLGGVESVSIVSVTMEDLLTFDSVCDWVERELGFDDCMSATENDLSDYLPTRMEFKVKTALVEGSIGAQASTGHIAFNLAAYSGGPNTILSSFLIVADYGGAIKTIEPMKYDKEMYRVFGLKNWNDAKLLMSAGKAGSLKGPAFTFDLDEGTIDELVSTKFDIHDVQRTYDGSNLWTLGSDLTYQELDTSSGHTLSSTDLSKTTTLDDPNHFQVIDEDTYGIVSARMNNAIYKIHIETGKAVWILGGDDGDFDIVGPDGATYDAGSSYWVGQHNAEYAGDGEYVMFDNNYGETTIGGSEYSRLLAVQVDDVAKIANVTFEYVLDTYSNIFGDNDRLPTSNLLACYWPSDTMDYNNQFSAKILEIERDSQDVAFEVKIVGKAMPEAACPDETCMIEDGFFMYSVERFYDKPLVFRAEYEPKKGRLSFATHNTYKQNSKYDATYDIYDATGTLQASGTFQYEAFWRETTVAVDGLDDIDGDLTLTVTNQHGTSRTISVSA